MLTPYELSPDYELTPQLALATRARDMFRRVRAATVTERISAAEMQEVSEQVSNLFAQALLVMAEQEHDLHPEDIPHATQAIARFHQHIDLLDSYPEFKIEPLTTSRNRLHDDNVTIIWRAFHRTLKEMVGDATTNQIIITLLSTGALYLSTVAYRKKIPVQFAAVNAGKKDTAYLAKIPYESDKILIMDDVANTQVDTVHKHLRKSGYSGNISISEFTGRIRQKFVIDPN